MLAVRDRQDEILLMQFLPLRLKEHEKHIFLKSHASFVDSAAKLRRWVWGLSAQSFQRPIVSLMKTDEEKNLIYRGLSVSSYSRVWSGTCHQLANGRRPGRIMHVKWTYWAQNKRWLWRAGILSSPPLNRLLAFFFWADQLQSLTDSWCAGLRTSETSWQFSFLPEQRCDIPLNVHNHT